MTPGTSLVLALFLVLGLVAPALAQIELTVTPAMTRGPEGAPVTIVEFVDFE
jgi:hypothetical protein